MTGSAAGIKAIDQAAGSGNANPNGDGGNSKLYGGYWRDFADGTRAMVNDGISVMPSALNECVISSELAELNGIQVGDTMSFSTKFRYDIPDDADMSGYGLGDIYTANGHDYEISFTGAGAPVAIRSAAYELKVSGIFYDMTDEYANSYMPKSATENRRNEILVTLDTLLSERSKNENNLLVSATFYLKNPDLLEKLESDCRAAGLSELIDVSIDTESYNNIVKPVQSLKSISVAFMVIVLILGAIVLMLLTSIAIRERKYEIGVLRAMGMKKRKVSFGLWTELLVITLACLVIGLCIGSVIAQPVTNILIEQQAEAAQNSQGQNDTMGMPGFQNANVKPLSEMQIMIDFNTILEIIGITLLLSTLAGFLSIGKITKYEPIKILMERN